MNPFEDITLAGVVSTVVYSLLGLVLFAVAYFIIEKLTPFSIRKEIEEDQNVALGLIVGAMMLGLGLIIAAAIASPAAPKVVAPQAPPAGPALDANSPT